MFFSRKGVAMGYVIGVDPGPKESAFVWWDEIEKRVAKVSNLSNEDALIHLVQGAFPVAIEKLVAYGQRVGDLTFETTWWSGRFWQAIPYYARKSCRMIGRKEVKLFLTGVTNTKDKQVREALVAKYEAVGTKKNPGPLYGISSHAWAALAVAVTFSAFRAGEIKLDGNWVHEMEVKP